MIDMRDNVFSMLPSEIRYADISDLAKLVWSEIYVENYSKNFYITNKMLSDAFKKGIITISRTISELRDHNLINIVYIGKQRKITVNNLKRITEQSYKIQEGIPQALESFFTSCGFQNKKTE